MGISGRYRHLRLYFSQAAGLKKGGLSGSYVSVIIKGAGKIRPSGKGYKTSTVKKSLTPVWNEELDFQILGDKFLVILDVYDENVLMGDDFLGRQIIHFDFTDSNPDTRPPVMHHSLPHSEDICSEGRKLQLALKDKYDTQLLKDHLQENYVQVLNSEWCCKLEKKDYEHQDARGTLTLYYVVEDQMPPSLVAAESPRRREATFAIVPSLETWKELPVTPPAATPTTSREESDKEEESLEPQAATPQFITALQRATKHLSPGWEAQQVSDGRIYYVDHITRTTTWERPHVQERRPLQAERGANLEPVKQDSNLPPGWEARQTRDRRVYYANHNTRTTSWVHPDILRIEELGPLPPNFEMKQMRDGRNFFVDHNTHSTQWEDPRLQLKSKLTALQSSDTSDLAARRCYEEALKQGYVESSSVVVAISGAAGSGKTHVRHLIFGKPPPPVRRSTGLECPIRAISLVRVDATHEEWQEISELEQCKILADALTAGVLYTTEDSDPQAVSVDSEAEVELLKTEDPISEADVEQHLSATTSSSLPSNGDVSAPTPASSTALPIQQSQLPAPADYSQLILELEQFIVSLMERSSGSKKLMQANFINFLDTGGQPLFHELLPYFIPTVAVAIFVTKLSESLDQCPIVKYYEDGKLLGEPYPSPLSHKDILRYSFRAIQSHAYTGESQTTGPKLLVVGTHRDKESKCSESRRQKNKKLLSLISTEFKNSLLYYGEKMEELIFPINAKKPTKKDRLVAKQLRSAIISVASSLKRTKTPISWHMLEIALRRLATERNKKILSREECLEVAKKLHISEDGLSAALEHLHGLLRILYYPRCLPNQVFIDPQIVLNKLTELGRHSHKLRNSPDKLKAIEGKWLKFRNEGIITTDLLETFPDDYSSHTFTPSHLLQILSYRLLTAEIFEGKYYMPCILPNLSDAEVEEHRVAPSSPVAPLVMYFPGGLAPSGVFCALVASLLSSEQVPSICKWHLFTEKSKPKCVSRNCISFKVSNSPGKVTLIDSYTHFEVHISAPLPFCRKYCPLIRDQIFNHLKVAFTTLDYVYSEETTPKDAFLCKHKDEDSSQRDFTAVHLPHPAEICIADSMWWSCTLAPETEYGECEDKHLIWFASSLTTEFQPVEFNVSYGKQPGLLAGQAPSPQISVGTTAVANKAKCKPPRKSHDQDDATRGLNRIPQRSDRPRLQELQCLRGRGGRRVRVIEEVAAEWEKLALALHFQTFVIDIVRRNTFHRTEDACREVLQRWLEGQEETRQPVNWATLIDSLLEAGFVDIAEDLQEVVEDPLLLQN